MNRTNDAGKEMKRIVTLLVLVFLSGCVGLTGGPISGRKTGRAVAHQLAAGMTIPDVRTVLADGAALAPPTQFIKDENGGFAPRDPEQTARLDMALRGFNKLTEANHRRVQTITVQGRGWGFFGFDVFYLYLDEENKLVAHAMDHFN